MKISFENFGVINKGEIEQKPLTILCGENNTGKTYAMYVMYFVKKNHAIFFKIFEKFILDLISEQDYKTKKNISFDFGQILESNIDFINNEISVITKINLHQIFNSNEEKFALSNINININKLKESFYQSLIDFSIRINDQKSSVLEIWKDSDSNTINIESSDLGRLDYKSFIITLTSEIVTLIFFNKGKKVLLLPAERAAIHLFYQELTKYRAYLINSLRFYDDIQISKNPQPIIDYISFINDEINIFKNQKSKLFSNCSTTIQNNILGGSYSLDETNNINFHLNNQKDTLPLHLTSSTVKTYFGLWFYLQHMAQEGDVLMIDEPELSLHPNNQRKIARLLAQLVNKGIKVVISTHSDYIVKEISNLIMLSQDNKNRSKLMMKFGIEEDEILSPDKVGAYLFKDNTIKAMEITHSEGIIATTFDEVIRDLSEETQTIFYEYLDEEDDE